MTYDSGSRDEIKRLVALHYADANASVIGRAAKQIFNFVTAIAEGRKAAAGIDIYLNKPAAKPASKARVRRDLVTA